MRWERKTVAVREGSGKGWSVRGAKERPLLHLQYERLERWKYWQRRTGCSGDDAWAGRVLDESVHVAGLEVMDAAAEFSS